MAGSLFESVKQAVTLRAAAEQYGVDVNRHGMVVCPFHDDRSPSLKLNDDYYHCFGCGASGDVIDFVARLFKIGNKEAAEKLAVDFGIGFDRSARKSIPKKRPISISKQIAQQREDYTFRTLNQYHHLLQDWLVKYDPKNPEDEIDMRFLEAVQHKEYVEYLLDVLITGNPEEKADICAERNPVIRKIAHRLNELSNNSPNTSLER